MAIVCPTKEVQETEEWKALVKEYGAEKATRFWQANNEIVPSIKKDNKNFVAHNGSTQEQALNKLASTQSEMAEEKADFVVPESGHELSNVYSGVEVTKDRIVPRYKTKSGQIIKGRVTDAQTKLFMKNKSLEEALAINNLPENIIKRDRGTDLHAVVEEIIQSRKQKRDAVKPDFLNDALFQELVKGVEQLEKNIQEVQNSIDPDLKYELLTENIVWDKKADKAGSIDLLAVFSDGSASIYDFKFINFEISKGEVVNFEDKLDIKEESWDAQIGEYKRMLKDVYGINLVRQSRILPVNVQYAWGKKGDKFEMTDKVKKLEMIGKDYVQPIPVADELTEDRRLNTLLGELLHLKKSLKVSIKSATNVDAVRAKIRRVQDSIRSLQLKKDYNYLVNEISAINKEINANIHINNSEDPNFLTDSELREFKQYLKVYEDFLKKATESIKDQIKKDPETYKEEFKSRLSEAMAGAKFATGILEEKLLERASDEAYFRGINNLTDLQRETSTMGNYTKYLSDWNHPIFRTFKKMNDEVIDNTRRDFNAVEEKLTELTDNLKEWGKSQGLSGMDIFNDLINPKTGNLVAEFTEDFWNQRRKAQSSKDIKWFKEHFEITEEDKKTYTEKLTKQKQYYEKFFNYKGKEWRDRALKNWVKKNNPTTSLDAWLNPYANISLKDKNKWQSSEYKKIQGTPALKEYYDYYIKMNEEFLDFFPKSASIKKNFVANISKDMIDMISEDKSVLKGIPQTMLQSLELREDDTKFGMVNPLTGEVEYRIPILYAQPLRDHKGAIDLNLKSRDLSRSLALFAKMAYNYKHASKIEDNTLTLKQVLGAQKQILTSKTGKPLLDPITKEVKTGEGSENTLKAFETFVNYYLYGQTTQSKDMVVKLPFGDPDKTYSGTKIVQALGNLYSLKTLGFNPVSAGAAYVGATANMHMVAHKGQFYDKPQLRKAHQLNIKGDEKAGIFFKYLEIEQEDLSYRKANELSASKISKKLTVDFAYSWLQKGDAAVDFNITIAMMQNYGTDPETGKVKRLAKLPEGTKSLWERAEVKNDKPTIEGFTESQYNDFRRKVRYIASTIKGQYSSEDLFMANTHILGQRLMHFRNWMPRMYKERMGKARYNDNIEEVELGRFKVFFGEMVSGGVLPGIKNALSMLGEISTWGAYKHKLSEGATSRYFDQFLAENPELSKKIEDGEMTRDELFEMYKETRIAQFRAMASELRMYLLITASLGIAGSDWDDDGEALYKEIPGGEQFLKIVNRASMELGFFFSPSDAKQILRSPIPLMGMLMDLENLVVNSLDEARDVLAGEDYKGVFDWEKDSYDRSPKFKYTTKFIPFWNPMLKFFDYFDKIAKED